MPIGLLGEKLGMTQVFREDGTAQAVTVLEAGPCMVTQVKTIAKDGYEAVQLSFGEKRRLNKAEEGHLRGIGRFRYLRELPPADLSYVQVGQTVDVSIFQPGDVINVTGTTKGRGFAGGIKRHGFSGGPKTHGQSDRHRAPGSIGAGTTPGRVFKGKRMAGHMGAVRVTARNVEVVQVDVERNLLLIKGSVPGANRQLVLIQHTTEGVQRLKQDPIWSRPVEKVDLAEDPDAPDAIVEAEEQVEVQTEATVEEQEPVADQPVQQQEAEALQASTQEEASESTPEAETPAGEEEADQAEEAPTDVAEEPSQSEADSSQEEAPEPDKEGEEKEGKGQ